MHYLNMCKTVSATVDQNSKCHLSSLLLMPPRENIIGYYHNIHDISENNLMDSLFLNIISYQIRLKNYLFYSPCTYSIWALTIQSQLRDFSFKKQTRCIFKN